MNSNTIGKQFAVTSRKHGFNPAEEILNRVSAFQPGVRAVRLSASSGLFGRILPAFDTDISPQDPAFRASFIPYRDQSDIDEETGHPPFTVWYEQARIGTYIGRTGFDYCSPQTLKRVDGIDPEDTADPFIDLYQYCRQHAQESYKDGMTVGQLLEKGSHPNPKNVYSAAIERPNLVVIMNAYVGDKRNPNLSPAILYGSMAALYKLIDDANVYNPPGVTPRDAKWPDYLLGDFTHPETGLKFIAVEHLMQNNRAATAMAFAPGELNKLSVKKLVEMPVSEDVLKERKILLSSECLLIKSYQEIVDMILEDGWLDRELVRKACGHRANIPAGRKASPLPRPAVEEDDDIPMNYSQAPAAAPAPSVVAENELFWVAGLTGKSAVKMTRDEIQSALEVKGSFDGVKIAKVGQKTYSSPEVFGFVLPPVNFENEAPPSDEDAPPVEDDAPPSDEDAPLVEDDEPPVKEENLRTATKNSNVAAVKHNATVSDSDAKLIDEYMKTKGLTEEEAKEYLQLFKIMKKSGPDFTPPPEVVARYVQLSSKKLN